MLLVDIKKAMGPERLRTLSFKVEHREPHVRCFLGEFTETLEDVLNIMSLPLYGDSGVLDSTHIVEDKKRV